jgi:RimJ/RimL family protein N-acetyltransferase
MDKPAYTLKTERLLIRCYEPRDAYLLKESIDESLDHLLPWLAWVENEPEEVDKKYSVYNY